MLQILKVSAVPDGLSVLLRWQLAQGMNQSPQPSFWKTNTIISVTEADGEKTAN